jgi:long-chain acyl-CoA synthetase
VRLGLATLFLHERSQLGLEASLVVAKGELVEERVRLVARGGERGRELIVGGHLRIMEHFDEDEFAWNTERFGTSNCFVVPTILSRLLAGDSRPLERCRASLRTIVSNAAPLATPTKEALLAALPEVNLNEFYGSTEAGIVTNLRPTDQLSKVRCAGQPFFLNHVEILDAEGVPVAPGEVGRLFSSSPYAFDGYWNLPEATADAFVRGMVGVGDLARFDDEGFVYIVDRESDMIITGGVNVYPREIEDALLRHPEILEAAVVGQPDDEWGEAIVAYVVCTADGVADQAVAQAATELAAYKRPKVVIAVGQLPRNSTGKLLKRELRAQHWNSDIQV